MTCKVPLDTRQPSWRALAALALAALAAQSPHAQTATFAWGGRIGGTDAENGYDLAVNAAGHSYVVGDFAGTADFDPGPGAFWMTSVGGMDGYVAKYDGDGNFVWAARFGGVGDETCNGVAVDGNGDVHLGVLFEGTVDFDPGPGVFALTAQGSGDNCFVRLDGAGNLVWAKQIRTSGGDYGANVAVDPLGNVLATGTFAGVGDLDPGPGAFAVTSFGSDDGYVVKLDSSGNFLWGGQVGGTGSDRVWGVSADAVGGVVVVGDFQGTADFDPGVGSFPLTSAGSADVFVSKLDSAGNLVWARGFGGTGVDSGLSLALDSSANVCVAGSFNSTVDFDPGAGVSTLTSAGSFDVFVSKLDGAGDFLWARRFGGTDFDLVGSVVVDGFDSVYATGQFRGVADFAPVSGAPSLTSSGGVDVFVWQLTGSGQPVWAGQLGGSSNDAGFGVAVDRSLDVTLHGIFRATADIDPGPGTSQLIASGPKDTFIAKLRGSCIHRNGSGINPPDFTCADNPVIGTSWTTSYGHGAATLATVLLLGPGGPATGPAFGTGELLISLMPAPLSVVGAGDIALALPKAPGLIGATFSMQGARLEPGPQIVLLNALDATVVQ